MITILSLGAGVQSSCLALMAEHGEIPKPKFAVFADTGAEPKAVLAWLEWLKGQLSYPVHIVQERAGLTNMIEESIEGKRFAGVPFFTESPKSDAGGMLRRQCTREFKIQPITRFTREQLGLKKGERVPKGKILVRRQIGISLDEIQRMKESYEPWAENSYPLVDKRMTRWDCIRWMAENGYPEPPRSACVYCPYKSNHEWRRLRDEDPEGWAEACRIDELARNGVCGTKEKLFVHKSMTPLAEADLSTDLERGQLSLWNAECDGMCGL